VKTLVVVVLLLAVAGLGAQAGIMVRNANSPSDVAATLALWLGDIGITESQVSHFVDWETGFAAGQNISGIAGLLPGGLVITDTSSAASARVQSSSSFFGGSNPVGSFALAHNEQAYLELDFSASPVDYISFQDIDHSGTSVIVHFLGGGTATTSFETTGASGNSAEFFGIFRNDMPRIIRVQLDATGDGAWGIDNLRYGVVPEPSSVLALMSGFAVLGGVLSRKKR